MRIDEVKNIIEKKVARKGYRLEERKSATTDSWYFKICSGKASLLFRVADHKTKADVITLRLDHKSTPKSVEGFVENRCRDLGDRVLRNVFGGKEI